MNVYEYTYTVVMRGIVKATTITDAGALARETLKHIADTKLFAVIRIDPPLPPVDKAAA